MRKNKNVKLNLNRQSVRLLTPESLTEVRGGLRNSDECTDPANGCGVDQSADSACSAGCNSNQC